MSTGITSTVTNGEASDRAPYRWRWYAFAVILVATTLDFLDGLVVTVAAPSIRSELGGSAAVLQWLTVGYTLAMAAGLMIGGRLGDIYGRKPMFLAGLAGFTVISLLAAVAGAPGWLIALRVAQGLCGAVMVPQGLGLTRELFAPSELGRAFGFIGPALGAAGLAGPLFAGWLIGLDLFGTGWRMVFLVNVPVGLAALAGAAWLVPGSQRRTAVRLDLTGAATVAVAAILTIYPLVQGREAGWPAWTFVCFAAALALFAGFAWHERYEQRAGRDPLVLPSLFRKRAFVGALIAATTLFAALIGFTLVLTLYFQLGLGYPPLAAALVNLPHVIGSFVALLVAGRLGLAARFGARLVHTGAATGLVGMATLVVTLRLSGPEVSPRYLAPTLLLMGAGLALAVSALFVTGSTVPEPAEIGSASGTLSAVQQFGGALGVALIGTVFFGLLTGGIDAGATARAEYATAFEVSLVAIACLHACTFLAAFLLRRPARS